MNLIYKCPVCSRELKKKDKALICDENHNYDISKEGYVNLLLANQKKTKEPGDSKFMIENRKYFLEQGHYDVLSYKLNEIILGFLEKSTESSEHNSLTHKVRTSTASKASSFNILDLGCGEGFYSERLKDFFEKINFKKNVQLWGIDISRPAIQMAAKRDDNIHFSVGSNFQLPYLNESFDIIFSIFSPLDPEELKRVLKPKGKIIVVRPDTNHLKELASLIYEKFELQGNPLHSSADLNMQNIGTGEVKYQIHLKKKEDIASLIAMTPYYWSLGEEKRTLLAQKQELITTVHFQLSLFSRWSAE